MKDEQKIFAAVDEDESLAEFSEEELRHALAVAQTRGLAVAAGWIGYELGYRRGVKA